MTIIVVTPAAPHPFEDTAAKWFYVLITESLVRGHEVATLSATEEPEVRVAEAERWLIRYAGRLRTCLHHVSVDRNTIRSLLTGGSAKALRREGRQRALNFRWDCVVERYFKVYRDLVA